MERTEFPGNDASWYRALLAEETPPHSMPEVAETTPDDPAKPALVEQVIETEPPPPEEIPPVPDDVEDVGDEPPEPAAVTPEPEQAEVPALDTDETIAADRAPEEGAAPPVVASETETTVSSELSSDALVTSEDETIEPEQMVGPSSPDTGVAEHPPVDDGADVVDNELDGADEDPAAIIEPVQDEEPHKTPSERSADMVGKLWTAQAPEGPIDGWAPDDIDSTMSSSRSFRWTSVVAAVAILVLVIVGLVLLPSITRNRANAHREMMVESLETLRGELPDTQDSLAVATEPTSTVSALNGLSTQLTAFSAKATAVDHAGRQPLPGKLPFTSSTPIDELVPIQQRLEPLASTALTIQQRIANLVEYRTLMSNFLTLPDLPTSADDSEQADLRVALASAQAESASILSELPDDVSLSDHRARARDLNDTFATWQVDYLEALRTQDTVSAETLIRDIRYDIDQLDAALVTPLAQIRRQTDTDLIDLAASIDEVVALAAGQEPPP